VANLIIPKGKSIVSLKSSDSKEVIHFRDKDFLYKDYHWPPGWYFYDEEEDLYGPFLSEDQTKVALKLYLKQLLSGQAPTQMPELLGGPKLAQPDEEENQ
jgi:hypothetical protein